MKYKLVGTNRATGARMTLELEASSRAAAEQKAQREGMEVLHVRDMDSAAEEDQAEAGRPGPPRHRSGRQDLDEEPAGTGMIKRLAALLLIVIAILAVAYLVSMVRR